MVQKKMNKLVVISGPTAVGKSAIGVECALRFGGEVVSADSMQIYKGMDIGTGKITMGEMKGVRHYMLDVAEPYEDYSVGRYCSEAKTVISDIVGRGKLPIVVGGTGLYINSLLFGHSFSGVRRNDEIRKRLAAFAEEYGNEALYRRLCEVDMPSAAAINVNDAKRIIRALEIFELTGKPRSEQKDDLKPCFDYLLLIIDDERQALYDRIDARVNKMFESGLVDEVKSLYEYKNYNSMQAIGYKEVISYLDGKTTLPDTIETVKRNSRRYAKRQLTFYRGMKAEKIYATRSQDISKIIDEFLNRGQL